MRVLLTHIARAALSRHAESLDEAGALPGLEIAVTNPRTPLLDWVQTLAPQVQAAKHPTARVHHLKAGAVRPGLGSLAAALGVDEAALRHMTLAALRSRATLAVGGYSRITRGFFHPTRQPWAERAAALLRSAGVAELTTSQPAALPSAH
jgi:hypothetical protein